MAVFKPGTRVKVVRHLAYGAPNYVGDEGVVVEPPSSRKWPYPVVVFLPKRYLRFRPAGMCYLHSFLPGELEPIVDRGERAHGLASADTA